MRVFLWGEKMPIPSPADFRNKSKKHSEVREMLAQMAENVEEKPKELAANTDLNNYLSEGTYVIRQANAAASISNIPEACILTEELGTLIVTKKPGDVTTRQMFFSTEGFTAYRLLRDEVWSKWSLGSSATKEVDSSLVDIKTLKTGLHLIPSSVSVNITNLPTKARGKKCLLNVIKVAQNNYMYILNDLTSGAIYFSEYDTIWVAIAGSNGEALAEITNLNSITNVGKYYCRFTDQATKVNNYPSVGKVGYLEVSRHRNDNSIYQRYVDSDNTSFYRISTDAGQTWSAWSTNAQKNPDIFSELDILDFNNIKSVKPSTLNQRIQAVTSSKNGYMLYGNPDAAKSLMLDFTDGQTCLSTNGSEATPTVVLSSAILKNLGDTLLISFKYSDSVTKQNIYYQQQPGVLGRLQITQNGIYNGSIMGDAADTLQIFIGGATDGSGVNGNIKPIKTIPNQWNTLILHVGNGLNESCVWFNGKLVDSFTTTTILNEQPRLLNEISTSSPMKIGKIAYFSGMPTDIQAKQFSEYMVSGFSQKQIESSAKDFEKYNIGHKDSFNVTGTISECVAAMICTDDGSFIPENVLYSKQTTYLKRIASITKVMTFLVLLDQDFKLNDVISRTSYDENAGSGLNIEISDQIYLQDALYNLMLPSSNITANIIARTYGHKILIKEGVTGATDAQAYMRWIKAMNDKAALLGMGTAKFYSASGYGNDTAYPIDILKMMNEAVKHPLLMKVWRTVSYSFKVINTSRLIAITNTNNLLANNPRVIGGKTGSGDGYHVACLSVLDDGRYLASVALNSSNSNGRFEDIALVVDQL